MTKLDPTLQEDLKNLIAREAPGVTHYVLHLDDEADMQDPIEFSVSQYGLKTLFFSDAPSALQALKTRQHEIVLVLSDLKMPHMDGFEFREAAKKIAPTIPFAILSAFVDKDTVLRGLALKISAFLSKPIDEQELFDLVKKEVVPTVKSQKEDRELREGFVADCESLIENAEELLLALEQDHSDAEALNRLFAIVHTLKGSSGFFEPKSLNLYAHHYEEILKGLQKSELQWTEPVSRALFKGFDVLKDLFLEFKSLEFKSHDLEALYQVLSLDQPASEVGEVAIAQSKDTAPKAAVGLEKSKVRDDVRVSVERLDEFMQLSGEVTVIRNMLNKCMHSMEKRFVGDRDVVILGELLGELHKINSGMQSKISEIRKVPVKSVVKVLPRAVRDLAKTLEKEVDLEVVGEELLIDTSIAEVLNNSLLHIVKNSVDHGLETPADRVAAGKHRKGKVTVTCTSADEKVVVEIKDDGKGLSLKAIKNKLLKNATHTQAEVDDMSPQQLYAMIFSSGFSTAAQVTAISGRGVGMSMVKDCVDAVGGEIQIESVEGKGGQFRLVLPVPKSVLISNCLTVRVGSLQFGVLRDDILRVLQLDSSAAKEFIRDLEGAKTLLFEGELLALCSLSALLALPRDPRGDETPARRIVVLSSAQDGRRLALEVDEILDVEDLVIKNLHSFVNGRQIFRGATFLDDGRVGMILSTSGLMDAASISKQRATRVKERDLSNVSGVESLLQSALVFRLSVPGYYAIAQERVFRIEEIKRSAIKHSGLANVLPYRGGILQIVSLNQLFGDRNEALASLESVASVGNAETLRVMVVEKNNRYIGIEVREITDMVQYSDLKTELAEPLRGVLGHFLCLEKTVCLLDVDAIITPMLDMSLEDGAQLVQIDAGSIEDDPSQEEAA